MRVDFLIKKKLGWTFACGLLVLVSFVLLHKPLLHGTGWNHSYFFNSAWILEFDDALKRGVFPPRWLHGGNNGLGSPSFYFYPPAPFYVTAVVAIFSSSKTAYAEIAAWAAFYMTLASGLTMFAWLRRQAGDILAVVGAVLYVLAPYHQVDYFVRGSMGETMAYIVVPLIMLFLQGTARATSTTAARPWIAGLALSYGALFYCHLTIALLVTISILPIYGLYLVFEARAEARREVALRCLAGGALGILLAASYAGPATFMQKYASLQWMFAGISYQPYRWTLLRPDLWPTHEFALSMAYLAYTTATLAAVAILAGIGRRITGSAREAVIWGGATLFGLLLYAAPWVWQGPTGVVLSKVQFPFRLLVGMEFAAITAVVMAAAAGRWLRLLILLPLCLFPLKRGFVDLQGNSIRMHEYSNGDLTDEIRGRIANRRTPDEHLPAGFDVNSKLFAADSPTLSAFNALPLAAATSPDARVVNAGQFPDGSVAVVVQAARPTVVVLRKFYFPTWEVGRVQKGRDPVVADQPYGPERLLSFTAEPGAHTYRIRIVRSTLEKVCDAISLMALLAALALFVPALTEALKKFRKAAI
jgi:hypothetical protein